MEENDREFYAKVHSTESFGTVDGPRNSICVIYARMPFEM